MKQGSRMRVVPISINESTLSVDGDKATAYRFSEKFFQILKGEEPTPRDLEGLGKEIFYNIFYTRDRKNRLEKWLQEAQDGTDIVFKIESDLEGVHEIPFELLYNDQVGFFLKRGRIHMVRDVPAVSKPLEPVGKDFFKMLFIISLPLETYRRQPLDPLDELNVVYRALNEELAQGLLEIDVLEKASLKDLNRRLGRQAYDIIHFSGHGAPGGRLVLEDEGDPYREREVSLEEFSRRVYLQNPVLYFLDACYTARASLMSPSLAYHLYRSSPRAVVIANLLSVYDHLATEGAGLIYGGLFRDTRPGVMLKDLRVSLHRDWWKPVIFASNPERPLFVLERREERRERASTLVHLPSETRVDYVYRYPLVRRASDLMEVSNHLVLHGVGGSGKSILAGYLARFFQGRFPNILFLDVREYATPMDLLKGILRILARQGIVTGEEAQGMLGGVQGLAPEFALDKLFRGVMDSIQGPLFLVLDNLEGIAQERDGRLRGEWRELIDQFLAREHLFLVLASRVKLYWDDRNAFGNSLTVGEYTEQEFGFLLGRLQRANKNQEAEYLYERLEEIRETFGFHPLTLARLMERRPGDVRAIVEDREFRGYLEFYRGYFQEEPLEAKKLLALEYPFTQEFLEHLVSPDFWGMARERLGIIEEWKPGVWRVNPVVRAYFSRDYTMSLQELDTLKEDLVGFYQARKGNIRDLFNIFALLLRVFRESGGGDSRLGKILVEIFNLFEPSLLPREVVQGFSDAMESPGFRGVEPGELADAESTLGKILAGRGKVEEGIGRLEDAIGNYKKAIELNPKDAEAYNNLASAESILGKMLAGMGKAEDGIGRLESAIDSYKRALELNPNLAEAYNNLANTEQILGKMLADRGRVEEGIGRLESAISNYKEALKLNPNYAEAYNNLAAAESILGEILAGKGRVEEGIGRLEDAIGNYKKAIELNPNYAKAYNNLASAEQTLGEILAGMGKAEEGIVHFLKAAKTVENLIEIYRRAGALDKCLFQYPRFFSLALKGGRDWEDEGLIGHLSRFAELFLGADEERAVSFVGPLAEAGVFRGVEKEALLARLSGPVAEQGLERIRAVYSDLRKVLA